MPYKMPKNQQMIRPFLRSEPTPRAPAMHRGEFHESDPAHAVIIALEDLRVLPSATSVLFPGTIIPLCVTDPGGRALLHDAHMDGGYLGLFFSPGVDERPARVGCLGRIVRHSACAPGSSEVWVEGVARIELRHGSPSTKSGLSRYPARIRPKPRSTPRAAREHRSVCHQLSVLMKHDAHHEARFAPIWAIANHAVLFSDLLCASLLEDPAERQLILESDCLHANFVRAAQCLDALHAAAKLPTLAP